MPEMWIEEYEAVSTGGRKAKRERIVVDLEPWEIKDCKEIAERRSQVVLTGEHKGKQWGSEHGSPEEMYRQHLLGIMGELAAWAWYYGVDDYFAPFYRQLTFGRGDHGYDLMIGGWTCEIKTVAYFDDPVLKVSPAHLAKKPHFWMLAAAAIETGYVHLVGIASTEAVMATTPRKYKPHLPASHNLREGDLRPIRPDPPRSKLLELLERSEA